MKKMTKEVIAALMVLALAQTGYAGPEGAPGDGKEGQAGQCDVTGKEGFQDRKEKIMDEVAKDLGLSGEQEDRIKQLHNSSREKTKVVRETMKAKQEELRNELNKPDTDVVKVDGIINELTELYRTKTKEMASRVLEMKKALTAEQFGILNEKMKTKMEEFKASKGFGAHGKHGGPGPEQGKQEAPGELDGPETE
ncbi:MAG: periplasmic heavy metal sensor [Candidatus Omnitrophica bacterium]|nr:periplasmic heavy metal sensor [Candidatus Omnitrophota bacterium]